MSVIVAYSAAATGSPLNKVTPPKHSLNGTGKSITLRLTVSPNIFPHCKKRKDDKNGKRI